ncbi:MAG: hypothetical protein QNJ36_08625 [Calothrix sp. MO_167.B42]|nr:hypothetical protein [Calothrix sp. MO_167.B42]
MLANLFLKDYPAALRRIVAQEPSKLIESEIKLPQITKYLDKRRENAALIEQEILVNQRKKLTETQIHIISSIRKYGYWQGKINNIFDHQEANNLISRCDSAYEFLEQNLSQYDYHQSNTVTLPPHYISRDYQNWIIYQAGLNEKLLQIAHQYIGLPVGYHGAEIRLSRANPDGLDITGPKTPHQDCEEGKKYPLLKAVLYLNNVTQRNGPFTIIKNSQIKPFVGFKGTLILSDTSQNLHHGMPLRDGKRMVLFWTYSSRRPRYPHRCVIWPHSNIAVRKMTKNMSLVQQQAARWREYLPFLLCPVRYYPFPGHNFFLGDRNIMI